MKIAINLVYIFDSVRKEIRSWPTEVKKDLGSVLTQLQWGEPEIRIRDQTDHGILVFHGFKKKTQKTPINEIETAKKRLKAFLKELVNEK